MQDVQSTLSVGTLIRERYVVQSLIGKGNTGAVYLVKDQRVKRVKQNVFALKEILGLSQQERYQLTFDSVTLRQLNHRSLPRFYHVFNDDKRSRVYIVMDYVEGPDLETLWQQQPEQRFTWPEVARIMAPVVDVVSYLHRQGTPVVHGDIKPINIIMAQPDEKYVLVDFGVARESDADGRVLSNLPGYQAPEQFRKSSDARADIYGLGATCYTLLTGIVPPHALVRKAQLEREQIDPLQPAHVVVPTVPLHVSRTIHRSMSIYPHERFSSARGFWQALQPAPKESQPVVHEAESSAKTPAPVVTEQRRVRAADQKPLLAKQPGKNVPSTPYLKKYAVPFVFLVLLLLAGSGVELWSLVQTHQATSAFANHTATSTPARSGSVRGGTQPIVLPTSSPGNYPGVVGSYAGTIADLSTKASSTIILQGIHQVGGTINGYFTAGTPLAVSGTFSGAIDFSKHFRFTVTDPTGHPVLFLEGTIQSATSLSGDFYRCAAASQGETCIRSSAGYGIWSAILAASSR